MGTFPPPAVLIPTVWYSPIQTPTCPLIVLWSCQDSTFLIPLPSFIKCASPSSYRLEIMSGLYVTYYSIPTPSLVPHCGTVPPPGVVEPLKSSYCLEDM